MKNYRLDRTLLLSGVMGLMACVVACNFDDPLEGAASQGNVASQDMAGTLDMQALDMSRPDLSVLDMPVGVDMPVVDMPSQDMPSQDMDEATDMVVEPCTSNPMFLSGAGSASDPYVICDAAQFARMNDFSGSFYVLDRDIDLEGEVRQPIDVFTGELDGRGFAIQNLMVMGDESFGGFCNVLTGTLRDVHFKDIDVAGRNDNVGGIAYLSQGATVERVSITGVVKGLSYVGLFAARISVGTQNSGLYEDIFVQGDVTVTGTEIGSESGVQEGYSGLFAGRVNRGIELKRIHTEGSIEGLQGPPYGPWIIGGIVGHAQGVTLEECTAEPVLNVPHGTRLGGLVGLAQETTIRHSWAQGSGDARASAGGLVGEASLTSNVFEYSWASMVLTTTNANFPPQGILGMGDVRLVDGRALYYNRDAVPQDRLFESTGYSLSELSSADNYANWPSPPWIIQDGSLPALDSQP